MKDELLERIPEIKEISDPDLREKTIAVLLDALEMGGWKVDDLERIPFTLLIPNNPVSLLTHIRAVTAVALKAGEVLNRYYGNLFQINHDILLAGAILHDVGKLLEFEAAPQGFRKSAHGKMLRHPFSGSGLAAKHGLPVEVQHIIATHAHEGDDGFRTPASVIVHHADFMNFDPLRDSLK